MAFQVRQHTGRFPVAARRTTIRLWFWEITAPGSSDRLSFENDALTHLNLEYQIRQHPVRFPVAARRTTIRLWFAEITASGSSHRFHLLEKDTCTRIDVQYQAHQATGRFPVAAPKNFHQTLVREDICIWFVTSFSSSRKGYVYSR